MIRRCISFKDLYLAASLVDIREGAIDVNPERAMVSSLRALCGNRYKA